MKFLIRHLGTQPYGAVLEQMQHFTASRNAHTADEIWLLQHPPVFTQGQAGKDKNILAPLRDIPIIKSDRGGQVTYHGPGQLIGYFLIDLTKLNLGIRSFVLALERLIIKLLDNFNIKAHTECNAPGVYVQNKKIASLGLRVRRGCTYHGIALNIDMDLEPFKLINPCGFPNLTMTQMKDWVSNITLPAVETCFAEILYDVDFS